MLLKVRPATLMDLLYPKFYMKYVTIEINLQAMLYDKLH